MTARHASELSRREREVMHIVYRQGPATAAEVRTAMSEPPSYSAVRSILRILERKGHLSHEHQGVRYVYRPTVLREEARRSALESVVRTYFAGSTGDALATLFDMTGTSVSAADRRRLETMIAEARKEGR